MFKTKLYSGVIVLSLVSLMAVGCAGTTITPTPSSAQPPASTTPTPPASFTPAPVTEEESQVIAEEYVRRGRTFVFDGIEDSLKLIYTETLRCPSCWQFTFEFESKHAGYGDRAGQALAEMITPHRAVITIMQGEVTYAVIDEAWDMIKQELVGK